MRKDAINIIGLFRASSGSLGRLMSDVFGLSALAWMVDKGIRKTVLKIRKSGFEELLARESHQRIENNIIVMTGAKPNETELQTARKLAKTNEFFIIFPNDGQIKEVHALLKETGKKRNDVYLIDKVTYKTIIVDIKTCGNPSVETIIAHLSEGVNQAPNIILDITGKISKVKLSIALRRGWSNRLKIVFLNYHGQWYLMDRNLVFDKKWITDNIK